MSLISIVRAWFRREPDIKPAPLTIVELKSKMELHEHRIDMVKRTLAGELIKSQIIPAAVVHTRRLIDNYEQAKAAYEKALVEQLAGLKDSEQ